MLKDILNLERVKSLSKNEQKEITGGFLQTICPFSAPCRGGFTMINCRCESCAAHNIPPNACF